MGVGSRSILWNGGVHGKENRRREVLVDRAGAWILPWFVGVLAGIIEGAREFHHR